MSKPQNDSVKQKVEHPNVEYDHNEIGFQNPRNGVAPDNVEAKTYCPVSNGKVRVERDILEITNNIPKNKDGKEILYLLKRHIKICFRSALKEQWVFCMSFVIQ